MIVVPSGVAWQRRPGWWHWVIEWWHARQVDRKQMEIERRVDALQRRIMRLTARRVPKPKSRPKRGAGPE